MTLLLGSIAGEIALPILPIAAGGFIYIAASDLIPHLHRNFPFRIQVAQTASLCVGVLLRGGLTFLEQGFGSNLHKPGGASFMAPSELARPGFAKADGVAGG